MIIIKQTKFSKAIMHQPAIMIGLMIGLFALLVISPQEAFALSADGQEKTRLANHIESWIGLGMVAVSFATAFLLNATRPKARTLGVFLAALICLSLAFTIFWLGSLGALDNVRPPFSLMDKLKPDLMRIWLVILAVAGFYLLFFAIRQMKRGGNFLKIKNHNENTHYGRVSRWLHWSIAILILGLIPMGIFASMIPESVWYRHSYYVVHKSIGLTVLMLIVVRLWWNHKSPRPAADADLQIWEKVISKTTHFLLYFVMIGFPVSGFMLSTYAGKSSYFYFWDLPLLWEADRDSIKPFAMAHKLVLPVVFYLLFVAHIAGVLKHAFIDKRPKTIQRMVG